ncbi:hypothetical protein [Salmonella enterica]|uniref:hypothetical protein n=1 Tax=Salmonella enterica TaxID=28901 RepID=UPI00111B33CF|nr:hypothetical protein [Salmonella enterica]
MLSGIVSSITAIKASIDLLQVILDAKSQSERENAVCEMRRQLTELQIQNAELAKTLALQYEEIFLLKQNVMKMTSLIENLNAIRYTKLVSGILFMLSGTAPTKKTHVFTMPVPTAISMV